jgi:predicted nuclease of predicted toxin-antitoxin system
MAALRFLLDENIHPGVAGAAWEMELDVVSVHDLRRRGRSDHDQLEFAAAQDRVLVTRNRSDYLHWTREFYHAGRPHRGVLLLDRGLANDQPAAIARALRRWAQAHSYGGAGDVGFGAYHVDFLKR